MTAPLEGPCQAWLEWTDLALPGRPAPAIDDEAIQGMILDAVTRTLWERTCRQFGTCAVERSRVRPLCQHRYQWSAQWGYTLRYGYGNCGCGLGHFVPMGDAPVVSIDGVWVDGTELDASAYRVDDWSRLVRTDGTPWINSAALDANEGDPFTLEVAWTYGIAVPPDGKLAAILLAYKEAEQVLEDCGVPSANATSVAREGVTITINPPKGDTGIVFVERWLGNFHCGGGAIFDPGQHALFSRYDTSPASP